MGIDLSRDTLLSQFQVWIPIPQLAPIVDYPRADRHHGSNVAIPRDSYSTTDTNGASLVNNRPSHATHQKNGTFLKKLISHWLMETTQPQLSFTATYAPASGEKTTPFSKQTVVLTKQDYIALKWEANDWRAQHARLVQREVALKAQVETLEAQIRDLTQRLYGKKRGIAIRRDTH